MSEGLKHQVRDFFLKTYKYVIWGYGYRLFTRFKIYRLLGSAAVKEGPGDFRILIFHDIRGAEFESFDRLISHLLETTKIISPAEAEARLNGDCSLPAKGPAPCLLTFDDGFASNLQVVRDVLSRHNLKAIFFLCPNLLDLPLEQHRSAIVRHIYEGCIDPSEVPDTARFMSWEDAKELVRLGHTIGSHTLSHSRLSYLPVPEQESEIVDSGDRLAAALNIPVNWFAYPFGDLASIDRSSIRLAQQRYQFCCSGLRGLNSTATKRMDLLREAVDLSSPAELQHLVVAGGMDFRHRTKVKKLNDLMAPAVSDPA